MNPVDLVVLAVLFLSSVVGLARGFTREMLGLAAWVLAIMGAVWAYPLVEPMVGRVIANALAAEVATYAASFIVLLIVCSVLADLVGRAVPTRPFGGADRVLGIGFGLARGAAIVMLAYVVAGLAAPPSQWPAVVRAARAMPLAYAGAAGAAGLVPASARPHVARPDDAGGKTI